MKSFKQLFEMPQLYTSGVLKGRQETPTLNKNALGNSEGKYISSLKGYHLYTQYPKDLKNTTIYAKDPKTQEIHMHVDFDGGHVVGLHGSKQSTIKAHELYHHLIVNHGMTIKSDTTQSPGGMKTWKKLKEYPDIKITHHKDDFGPEKRLKLLKPFEKNYSTIHRDSFFKATKK